MPLNNSHAREMFALSDYLSLLRALLNCQQGNTLKQAFRLTIDTIIRMTMIAHHHTGVLHIYRTLSLPDKIYSCHITHYFSFNSKGIRSESHEVNHNQITLI
jgi:hypothetical protein